MATIVIKNVTAEAVYLRDLSDVIEAGETISVQRSLGELTSSTGLNQAIAAGTIQLISTTVTAQELYWVQSAGSSSASFVRLFAVLAPGAASTAGVHATLAATAANVFPGPITNPDVLRNVSVTFSAGWDGGNVTVTGTDQFDAAVSETFTSTPGSTVAGVKIFKTVTGITKATIGTTGTASVGRGNKLGVAGRLADTFSALLMVDNAGEGATLDATYHAFTPTTTLPDGVANYALIANVLA